MESQNQTFWQVAAGVFVGGLLLVLFLSFWQIALGIAAVIGVIWVIVASETVQRILKWAVIVSVAGAVAYFVLWPGLLYTVRSASAGWSAE